MKTGEFEQNLLGKFVIVFLKSSLQTVLFKGKPIQLSMMVDGLIVKISEDYLFLSEGKSDKIERVVPRDSIAYIEIDPEQLGQGGAIKVMDYGDVDGEVH